MLRAVVNAKAPRTNCSNLKLSLLKEVFQPRPLLEQNVVALVLVGWLGVSVLVGQLSVLVLVSWSSFVLQTGSIKPALICVGAALC